MFNGVIDFAKDFASDLVSDVKEAGKDAGQGLVNKFNSIHPDSFSIPEITIGGDTFQGQELPKLTVGG